MARPLLSESFGKTLDRGSGSGGVAFDTWPFNQPLMHAFDDATGLLFLAAVSPGYPYLPACLAPRLLCTFASEHSEQVEDSSLFPPVASVASVAPGVTADKGEKTDRRAAFFPSQDGWKDRKHVSQRNVGSPAGGDDADDDAGLDTTQRGCRHAQRQQAKGPAPADELTPNSWPSSPKAFITSFVSFTSGGLLPRPPPPARKYARSLLGPRSAEPTYRCAAPSRALLKYELPEALPLLVHADQIGDASL